MSDRSVVPLIHERGSMVVDVLAEAGHRQSNPAMAATRVAHTFGSFAIGTFTPSKYAAELCKSPLLDPAQTPESQIVARFSPFAAKPPRNDSIGPYGLAIRVTSPQEQLDLLTLDLPLFLVRDRDDFLAFARSLSSPLKLLGLLLSGRVVARGIPSLVLSKRSQKRYTDRVWNSQSTFWLISPSGERVPVRHRLRPKAKQHGDLVEKRDKANRLDRQLQRDLHENGSVTLVWEVIDGSGLAPTRLNDATRAFPKDCPIHTMGEFRLSDYAGMDDEMVGDHGNLDALGFSPLNLPVGIEPSDDPLLGARSAAMAESQIRRAEARLIDTSSAGARVEGS